MTRQQFERLLAAYGADLQRWPATQRQSARALLARDPALRAAQASAARLDALLDRVAAPAPPDVADRVAAALRALPPQADVADPDLRPGGAWRAALAELWWELRAVPRIPSMVAVLLLGLVVGFASLGLTHLGGGHVDLSALLFEPGPSDWLPL